MPAPVLHREAVYLSPSGRRCRWLCSDSPRARQGEVSFVYLDDAPIDRALFGRQGFTLTRENLPLMREEVAS